MNIFPEQTLSATELDIVAISLSNPAVKKYLHTLAYRIGTDIVTGAKAPGQSAEDYLLLEASLKGQLAALNTLLEIEAAQPT